MQERKPLNILIRALFCIFVITGIPHRSFSSMYSYSKEFYRFNVGNFECTVLNEGTYDKATIKFLFSNAPADSLEKILTIYNVIPDSIRIPLNCLLIDTGEKYVLIDTGYGTLAELYAPNAGKLIPNLLKLDIKLEEIDFVILTHCHPDHIGGCTTNDKNNFPNAKYFMWKSEWNSKGRNHIKLKPITNKIELLDSSTEITPGVIICPAPGHTPGHIIISIHSKDETLIHISDLLGHPIHVEFPHWTMDHEYDKLQAVETRLRILNKAMKEKILLHAFHLGFPGLGYIVSLKNKLKWQPINLTK